MSLTKGTKLGPYEIASAIGAGGMGEVYRARDTRLDRYVAIKIIHSDLSCTPELKGRFEREARVLSSLSHPHICSLYDVGSSNGVEFLVMELLDGETLAARLQRGRLPFSAAVKLGIEIADALARAHRVGVMHRDLKPSNIMLTANGAKLMDFGLAKPSIATPGSGLGPYLAGLATATMPSPATPLSSAGNLIGTIQYMAPEQIEGKEADARSDIFALGSVLYEAVAGRRAFEGKTHISVASAILQKDPPPIPAADANVGLPSLEYTIRTCMAKEPEERFQSAHDVKLQLGWLAHAVGREPPAGKVLSKSSWIAVGVVIMALLTTISFLLQKVRNRTAISGSSLTRFSIVVPPPQEIAVASGQAVALSPDGMSLAYVVAENGVARLLTRRFEQRDAVAIPESEGATFPFFSPNGDWVAFFSQGKLKKAPTAGGTPVVICEVPTFFGGTWTPQDVIVVALPTYGLAKVSANGGSLQKISDPTKGIIYPQGPTWLAGGEWIAFTDYLSQGRSIKLLKLSTGELRTILTNARQPAFLAGRLVYYQGDALWASPFDPDRLSLRGSATKIESGINEENYVVQASVSEGALAYVAGSAGSISRALYTVDRKGRERKLDVPPRDYVDPVLSPDGKRLACLFRSTVGQQLVVLDRESGLFSTLISSGMNTAPAWTADGKSLIFDAANSRQRGIYRVPADGSSEPQLLKVTALSTHVTSIAGEYGALAVSDPETSTDLWILNMNNPAEMRLFKRTPAAERQGTLAPDGHWMAYASNESGRSEIYIEPVPGPGARRQISSDGGEEPRWVRNGKEITYRNGTKMMSVPVKEQPAFQVGKAVVLFHGKFDGGMGVAGYDVTPDGQTFVMTRSEHTPRNEIRVVVGWLGKQANE